MNRNERNGLEFNEYASISPAIDCECYDVKPLTLEQSLKRAMSVPPPAHDPKPPKGGKGRKKVAKRKKG